MRWARLLLVPPAVALVACQAATPAATTHPPSHPKPSVSVHPGRQPATAEPSTSDSVSPTASPTTGGPDAPWLPQRSVTPGAVRTTVADSLVCPVPHTSGIRPPVAYTEPIKRSELSATGTYSYLRAQFGTSLTAYSLDHLVPLETAGDPRSVQNLFPEPHTVTASDGQPAGSYVKDRFENYANHWVCAGATQAERDSRLVTAQGWFENDWYAAYVAAGRPTGGRAAAGD